MFWDATLDPMTIRATASPCDSGDPDAFDIQKLKFPAALLKDAAGEELAIQYGAQTIRLSLEVGSLLAGPVCLDFHLRGREYLQRRLLALTQLEALLRLGRVPRAARGKDRKVVRPALLVRALDALAVTNGPQAAAAILFGPEAVASDWDHESDYMRSQTRRLIARARRLAAGGYLALLR